MVVTTIIRRQSSSASLKSRLNWLIAFRLIISILAMAAILVLEARFAAIPTKYVSSYYTLIVACGVNIIYFFLVRLGSDTGGKGIVNLRWLAIIQILGDIMIESLLVYFTGIDRVFAYLYFATIASAAILISPVASYFFTSLAVVALSGVSLAYFFSNQGAGFHLPFVDVSIQKVYVSNLNFILPYLFFFSLSLYVVAFLASQLSEEASHIKILNEEILRNMSGGVVAVGRDGRIAFINPQAIVLMGPYSHDNLAANSLYSATLPKTIVPLIERSFTGAGKVDTEIELGGRIIAVTITTLADANKSPRGVVVILNDVTHRREAERMKEEAEKSRVLVELSAGVAHEIRNPLASVRGAAQELQNWHLDDEDYKRLTEIIVKESDRLDKIIKDFLDFASEKPLELTLFNISDVLRETISLLETSNSNKTFTVKMDIPKAIICKCSPDKLKQVFLNVGLNAVSAIPNEGGVIRIKCETVSDIFTGRDDKHWIRIEFEDNGVGISREAMDKIFAPFFSTKPQGIGMGLTISRKIIQQHGGYINIESRERQGTKCSIWLPA